jgi:hypothetical protein
MHSAFNQPRLSDELVAHLLGGLAQRENPDVYLTPAKFNQLCGDECLGELREDIDDVSDPS